MVAAYTALRNARDILAKACIPDCMYEARLLYRHVTGQDSRLCADNAVITPACAEELARLACKRAEHYPLQYILGEWEFMGLCLKIGEGVLIPRADTELVCEAAAKACASTAAPRIIDLCSGSGALALGVKSLVPLANITAVELSDAAYAYLKLNCGDAVSTVKADIFGYERTLKRASADIIMANPPYISLAEYTGLARELGYEPRMALTDGGDGLSFYRYISREYKHVIISGGHLIMEIGYNEAEAVQDILAKQAYSDIRIAYDYGGNARIVTAQV